MWLLLLYLVEFEIYLVFIINCRLMGLSGGEGEDWPPALVYQV